MHHFSRRPVAGVSWQRILHLTLWAAGLGMAQGAAMTAPIQEPRALVTEVPAGPAFVQLPGRSEVNARRGLALQPSTLLRTNRPGRMQVRLSDGRQFRIGGDARIKLAESEVQLLSGSIIGWVQPGGLGGQPFRIKTRLATASIQGTTVFLELKDESLRVLSWEGKVQVTTNRGRKFTLESGQQLLLNEVEAQPGYGSGVRRPSPERIADDDAQRRLDNSPLINGFSTPLETLTTIEQELDLKPR